jgi:hypothetical protein
VIKPIPLRPVLPGGFTVEDFVVDEAAGTATCPAGVTRPISRTRLVTFKAACRGCPIRAHGTTAEHGRSLHLHPQDPLLRAHGVRNGDPHVQADYRRHRPMVERSIAWLTRGNRRLPCRGVLENDASAPPAPARHGGDNRGSAGRQRVVAVHVEGQCLAHRR